MICNIVEYYDEFRITKEDRENLFNVKYLEDLFYSDLKKLMFIVYYYYLTKAVIPEEVSYSNIVSIVVTTLVDSVKSDPIKQYFSKYFNVDEIRSQWVNIHKEADFFKKRKETLNRFTVEVNKQNKDKIGVE